MANESKYTKRFPIICPAGRKSDKSEPVESLLKEYSPENLAELLVNKRDTEKYRNARKASAYASRVVYEENMTAILNQSELSRFRAFEKEFMESLFYKDHPLGKARPVYSKPAHITNESTTFGIPSVKSDHVYDIVLPPKKYEEVLRESQAGHANYIRSHGAYNHSEQIRRGYNTSSFNSNCTFGMKKEYDSSGMQVKRILKSCYQPSDVCYLGRIQEEVGKRTKFQLGKPLNRMDIPCQLPADFTYGNKTLKPKFNVKGLIYGKSICKKKMILYEAIAHFNVIRRYLKKKGPTTTYLLDIRDEFYKNSDEFCSWQRFFEVMAKYHIPLSETKAKIIAEHYKLLDDNNPNNVKYGRLMDFLDIFIPLPEIGVVDKFAPPDHTKLTTYREMTNDLLQDDKICEADAAGSVAGHLPPQFCMADLDSLPTETSIKAVISPCIQTHYGLSHRDYLLPRNKEFIRSLFMNDNFGLSEEDFEKFWEQAKTEWTSKGDMVSIEAFIYSMKKNSGSN